MPLKPIDPARLQTAIEQRFACLQCGHCCKGPGLVHIEPHEEQRLADYLQMDTEAFRSKYMRELTRGSWVLHDKFVDGPRGGKNREQWCIFLERLADGKYICTVNPAKPDQCGSFPAAWMNTDSLRSCAGLRALVADLRREDEVNQAK